MTAVRARFAVAVLLAVLVVATAAAGVDGTGGDGAGERSPSPESGVGAGSNTGVGSGNESGVGLSTADVQGGSPVPALLIEHAVSIVMVLSITVPIVYAIVLVWQEGVGRLLRFLGVGAKRLVAGVLVFLAFVALFVLLSMLFGGGGGGLGGSTPTSGTFLDGDSGGVSITLTAVPVGLVVVGALAGIVLLVLFSDRAGSVGSIAAALTGGQRRSPRGDSGDGPGTPPRRTDFEDVDASNAVYRAWRDLAGEVEGVDLRSHTPTEVAATALERGFDRDAVETLTDCFEQVRYGGRRPTDERETTARTALERIRAAEREEDR
jgi:hypothetical protein